MTDDNLSSLISDAYNSRFSSPASSFRFLKKAADILGSAQLAAEIKSVETRYYYLLKFLVESTGEFSAARDIAEIHNKILPLILRAQTLMLEADTHNAKSAQLRYQRRRPEENLESLASDFLAESERLRTDPSALLDSRSHSALERLASDIFKRLWASEPLTDDESMLMETFIHDNSIPAYFREYFVNAIGLGSDRFESPVRLKLLESAMASDNRRIAIAAEIWYVMAFINADGKFESEVALPHIADIFHAFVRGNAPKINAGMPNLMELGRKMQDNPLERPDISPDDYEAIKRMNDAQARGENVFSQTLGRMRYFPFFADFPNWFMPFHSDHSALAEIVDGEGAAIAELVERMPMLSDGDKYALILSMAIMPAQMRASALTNMVDSIHKVSDTPEFDEAMENSAATDRMLVGQFVDNLFNFIKINAEGRNLCGSATTEGLFLIGRLLPDDFNDYADERDLIGRLFKAKEFEAICRIQAQLPANFEEEADADSLGRIATAYYKDGDESRATGLYLAALQRDKDNIAALKGLVLCHQSYAEWHKIIGLLQDRDDNDASLLEVLGEAYIHTGEIEKAIETLHNLDYASTSSVAKAPLAWALTMSGDYEAADIFFADALESQGSPELYLKRAIHLWLFGKRQDAVDMLQKAYQAFGNDFDGLCEDFSGLSCYFKQEDNIVALLDTLLYRLKDSGELKD